MSARTWKYWDSVWGDSSLAKRLPDDADDYRRGSERGPRAPVRHLVVHMTGRSVVSKAQRKGIDPLAFVLDYYTSKATSSHYLLGWGGELWQMTDDRIRVGHVGVTSAERRLYLSGAWSEGIPDREGRTISEFSVRKWRQAWPHHRSPQHLFAGRSINDCSVGVEMPPCRANGKYLAEPLRDGLWHTAAQHVGIALLACDLAERWDWPDGWWRDPLGGPRTPSLPGHEDVDLYGRSQKTGGWDPGALRSSPRWDWVTVDWLIGVRRTVCDFRRWAENAMGRAAVALF